MNPHICLLVNPLAASGRAMEVAAQIEAELKQRNISFDTWVKNWDISFFKSDNTHHTNYTDIFLVGGDGTLNYYANHYRHIPLPVTFFPGGTGNDVHWMIYGKKTIQEQIDLALTQPAKPFDLGRCNELYFANQVGIGFEGKVAKALTNKKKKPGQASFKLTVLRKIFSYRSSFYTITLPGKTITGRKLLVDICNGQRAGGGFHVAPQAIPDDGLLDLVIAEAMSPMKRFKLLPVIEKGAHLGLKEIKHERVTDVTVESDRLIEFHLDGEYHAAEKLQINIVAGGLRIKF